MRVVVAGGAGFLGSHLCDQLLDRGDDVIAVDDLSTGFASNLAHQEFNKRFQLVVADVSVGVPVDGEVDAIFNLASPASPPAYLARPLQTLAVGSDGTRNLLELAEQHDARFIQASTSEVYGNPLVHPQNEDYWGNVNPIGPRSVYDESKRFAEALIMAHNRALGTNVGIARIFNTFGPRLSAGDGRVISNFIVQALQNEPLTVYGDGSQTRSLCYVTDTVGGLVALLDSDATGPVNLGNPIEFTVLELAQRIISMSGSSSVIEYEDLPIDDPQRRRPDITLAKSLLGWDPSVNFDVGLTNTIDFFKTKGMVASS
jgi:dTDP-glucose 4,6-dehydratase